MSDPTEPETVPARPADRERLDLDPLTIRANPKHQSRVDGLDAGYVAELARVLKNGGAFTDDVPVYRDAKGQVWLDGDGFHRHAAAVHAGVATVRCAMRKGVGT